MYRKIKNSFEMLQNYILTIVATALILIMMVVLLQTFTRFVIFHSLPWSEELSRYLFVFVLMFGLNLAIKENMLIRIDAIDYLIGDGKLKYVLEIIRILVGLVASCVIVYGATFLFKVGMIQKSPAMQLPMIIMYSIVFCGYLLSSISLVFKLIDKVLGYEIDSGETA